MYENKKQKLDILIDNLNKVLIKKYDSAKHRLEILKSNYILNNPELLLKDRVTKLNSLIEKLELVNPLGVLKRGYSLTYFNNKVIKDINKVKINDMISVRMENGTIDCKVIEKNKR